MFLRIFASVRHTLEIRSLDEIDSIASSFLEEIGDNRIVAFYAPMGAGKTTFTSAICRCLGVDDDAVSSPTFSIVNEYRLPDGQSLFHFDFYRINTISEALDIGYYDYVDSGSLCLIEWPENIEEILPDETLRVRIGVNEDGTRILEWED